MTTRARLLGAAAALVAAALALAGCSSSGGTSPSAGSSDQSSTSSSAVTIKDAFGETTIKEKPKRVVTLGWGSTDAAIALGVDPVAMPFQQYAGDKNGVLPWIKDAIEEKGMKMPTVLPNTTDDPPYEAIAAAKPDLILAPYSGLTAKQDRLLKAIAPTVAYPDQPWATPWKDIITISGKALFEPDKAEQVIDEIDDKITKAAEEHPEFQGKTIAEVWDSSDTFYVYKKEDPRVQFALDLGFTSAPSVEELANGDQSFYYTLSHEKVDQLTSDVLVSYADTDAAQQQFLTSSWGSGMQQVKKGAVAKLTGPAFISAVSPPTALSLSWGLDDYVKALSAAAKAAG
ncbi:iron-siderophore ABC transporter substrate-binding protein [Gryllotalpicola ginsengisoli]|uniref:iron-siderophore ABC transporter substrate-binding protein n=1 Tax=Gryllotalpicola ginsengisoli TaxID=444608 RepID=UPI0003B41424|nr:iron-siderophore ABC transporter substrate-binding protein [Gryllotalpicola ginsengisoli]